MAARCTNIKEANSTMHSECSKCPECPESYLSPILPADADAMSGARRYIDALAKPLGSLGELEIIVERLAGIFGGIPKSLDKKRMLIFCADNGVHAQGISPVPQSVTQVQGINIARGITGVGRLALCAGAELEVYDVGVNAPASDCAPLIDRKIMSGTRDFTQGPAMEREQALSAIEVGRQAALKAAREGVSVIGLGEMGICNTCTSAAVLSALTGADAEVTVGRGAGLNEEQFMLKREVVRRGIALNAPDPDDPVDVMRKVGGLDICAMTGAYIGAAQARIAVIVDGFIGMVSALCAVRISESARDFMFGSHVSAEPAFQLAARSVGLSPKLALGMRLGEGSGCPIMMQIMDDALFTMNTMVSFEQADIDSDNYVDIREQDGKQA